MATSTKSVTKKTGAAAQAATKKAAPKKATASRAAKKPAEKSTGEDFFICIGKEKHEFSAQISALYAVKEYFWKGELVNGAQIKFERGDGHEVPVHHAANCGYTLVGKAKQYFSASKALCANGEDTDDQEYVYINEHSELFYTGVTGSHTVYVRVYDNTYGNDNDRWVVISID